MHSHTCRDRDELADSGKLSHDALRAQLEAKTYGAFRAQARSRMRRGEPPSLGRTGALSGRASVHQRLRWRPKNKTEKGTEKKKQETPFLTFWRTHVVAHFDDGDDEGDDDDGEDDDKHDDDVVQDLPCRRISDGVRVFVWTCISGLSSSDRVCLLCSSWGLNSLCRLLGILTRAHTPADR